MVLQYVAVSFHLPSVSSAKFNTVQYPKPYKRSNMPTIPAVLTPKGLLLQSTIMTVFLHSHNNLLSDICPYLPTYNNHNVTQFRVCSVPSLAVDPFKHLTKKSNYQHITNIISQNLHLHSLSSFSADLLKLHTKLSNCQNTIIYFSFFMPVHDMVIIFFNSF
jgi:hypothetical protein